MARTKQTAHKSNTAGQLDPMTFEQPSPTVDICQEPNNKQPVMDNLEVPQAPTDNPDTQQVPIDQPNNPEGQPTPTDNHDNPPPPPPVASTSKAPDTGNQGNAGTGSPTKTMTYTKRWTAVVQDWKRAVQGLKELRYTKTQVLLIKLLS